MILIFVLLFLCITLGLSSEVCRCPPGYALICDKSVTLTLKNTCAEQCIDYLLPESDTLERHTCTVREEILSQSRPAYVLDVLHHPCFCISKSSYEPVCNTHFVTYINQCAMECIKPESMIAEAGVCVAKNQALSCAVCFRNLHPVCATNGETYPNKCLFECFKKENSVQDITLAHDGTCTFEDSPFIRLELGKRSGHRSKKTSLESLLLPLVKRQRKRKYFKV